MSVPEDLLSDEQLAIAEALDDVLEGETAQDAFVALVAIIARGVCDTAATIDEAGKLAKAFSIAIERSVADNFDGLKRLEVPLQ